MADPFDIYADAFLVTVTPFGANLSFQLREAHPTPHATHQPTQLGTVRTSVEHLKLMVMMIRNQIRQAEKGSGVKFEVPTNMLAQVNIALEDWEGFWK